MSVLGIFACSFAFATLLYVLVLPFWASAVLFTLAVVGAVVFTVWNGRKKGHIPLICIAVAFSLLWCYTYEIRNMRSVESLAGEDLQLEFTALENEEITDYGSKVLCKYHDVRVMVYLFDCEDPVRAGNRLLVEGVLEAETIEEGLAYIAKDVYMTARQTGMATVSMGEKTLRTFPARTYGEVCDRITELFPEDTAPFALALLTGNTEQLSYGFRNKMSLAGISHVVAVSGMHVSLICSLVLNLCLRRKRTAAGVCLCAMWFFGAMLGFSPSVTRAVVMNSVLLMAPILRREYDSPTALGFALLILLLKNPFSVASPGLQLSFASVVGILLVTIPLTNWLRESVSQALQERKILWGICSFLFTSVATTLGASLCTIPLVAYYFGTVSLISFVSNLLLLPLISLIFTLGYPLLLLSYCVYPVAQAIAGSMSIPIRWVVKAINFLGEIPYGALYSRSVYAVLWLITTYCLLGLGVLLKRRGIAVLLSVSLLISVPFLQKIHVEAFRFTMLDVGQGQCLMTETGNSVAIIDCGGSMDDASGEETARELLSRGYRRVEALILTHFDRDHTGGVLQFMERIQVQCLYLPDISPEDPRREQILQKAEEQQVPVRWVQEDVQLTFDGGTTLDIFAPVQTKSENDGLCLLLSGADYDILVTGDLSVAGERKLIQTKALPDLEILIAGHHGAADSTGQALLEHTMPEELLISVGVNSYGHPDPKVLERAENLGTRVRRTDREGTITITR